MTDNANPYDPPATGTEARRDKRRRSAIVVPLILVLLGAIGVVDSLVPLPVLGHLASFISAAGGVLLIVSGILYGCGRWVYTAAAVALALGAFAIAHGLADTFFYLGKQ